MRGGARNVELFSRAYFAAFIVALGAAVGLSGSTNAVAVAKPVNTTTTAAPPAAAPLPPPTTAVAAAPAAPVVDLEHRLPFDTAPDGRPAVVLTFDDGPHPWFTPRVLDVLASRGVKAVFCVVGTEIARYPSVVARIAADGHALCDHTENHDTHMSTKDAHYTAAMIRHPWDLIRDITGAPPQFYRGPGGNLSTFIIDETHRLGLRVLGWSVDPADYFKPGAGVIQDRIMARVHPGAVVLMHDGGGDRTQTVEQLAGLIDRLRAAGYTLVLP